MFSSQIRFYQKGAKRIIKVRQIFFEYIPDSKNVPVWFFKFVNTNLNKLNWLGITLLFAGIFIGLKFLLAFVFFWAIFKSNYKRSFLG